MPSIILAARGRITTYFREDIGRGFPHNGVDQGHGDGTREDLRIKAPADGIVIAHGPLGSYGKRLVIRHPDGWTSLLAHHANQYVTTGDRVFQGGDIAEMGNTGTIFVHNHQELRDQNGNQRDPLQHLGTTASNGVTLLEEDMGDGTEATAKEAVRIGNVLFVQNEWIIAKLVEIEARQAVGATEATVNEAVRVANATWSRTGEVLSKPSTAIDPAKLATALRDAGMTITIDSAALVKAIDESLADDFAAIPGDVRNAIVK